jgi:hypothetical protein
MADINISNVNEMSTELDVHIKYDTLIKQSLGSESLYIRVKETLEELTNDSAMDNRTKGGIIASVMNSMVSSITNASMQTALSWSKAEKDLKLKKEETVTKLELGEQQRLKAVQDVRLATAGADLSVSTKDDKIAVSNVERQVAEGSKDAKIDLTEYQAKKARNDASYVASQEAALEQQVVDNRKIKGLDSLADTYGTFGAGGINLSPEMWATYFGVVNDLTGADVPTDTDQVEKV